MSQLEKKCHKCISLKIYSNIAHLQFHYLCSSCCYNAVENENKIILDHKCFSSFISFSKCFPVKTCYCYHGHIYHRKFLCYCYKSYSGFFVASTVPITITIQQRRLVLIDDKIQGVPEIMTNLPWHGVLV